MWDRVRCLLVCQFVSVFVSVPADQRVSLYNVFVFGLFIAQAQTHRHTFSLSPIFFAVSAVTQSASQSAFCLASPLLILKVCSLLPLFDLFHAHAMQSSLSFPFID